MGKVFTYFFIYAIIQVACSLGLGALFGIINGNSDITSTQVIVTSVVSNVIAIAVFVLAKWTPFSREFFKGKPWTVIYWSVIIALGMLIPANCLEDLIPDTWKTDILAEQFKMVLGDKWGYLAIGLMAPIAEELVFRGGIQKAAIEFFREKFNRPIAVAAKAKESNLVHWSGIVFTALLFAAMHGNPAQIPHAFIGGLLLGWMCYRSGSIIPGIVLHWVNNTTAFILYNVYPQSYNMETIDFFGDSWLRLGLALLFSILLFGPAVYQYHRLTSAK